jgi:hypothetical protein
MGHSNIVFVVQGVSVRCLEIECSFCIAITIAFFCSSHRASVVRSQPAGPAAWGFLGLNKKPGWLFGLCSDGPAANQFTSTVDSKKEPLAGKNQHIIDTDSPYLH